MAENLRTYETICLTKVDMPVDKFETLVERLKSAITTEAKGEVLIHDDWGKAKIAYPIDREPRAQWTYLRYQSTAKAVDSIKHQLKINEFVLREMTTRCPEDESDYKNLKATFAKDLNERFSFRDDRPRRRKPGGRDGGGRDGGGRDGGRPRRFDRDERSGPPSDRKPIAPATPKSESGSDT